MKNFSFELNNSTQDLEEKLLATLICCNESLSTEYSKKLNYHNNMMKLFESVSGIEQITPNIYKSKNLIDIKNYRKNNYAYTKDVLQLINDYEKNSLLIIKTLNENLKDFNITSFKDDLFKYVSNLSYDNDFNILDTLSQTVTKTKILAKKPIYIYGYDIVNNILLQKELEDNFNIKLLDIISILFDKSNKQLLFVFKGKIITYVIENNSFGYYNQIWKVIDEWFESISDINLITKDNYFEFISRNINSNLIELFRNYNVSEIKFNDNLYFDSSKTKENIDKLLYRNANLFIKS